MVCVMVCSRVCVDSLSNAFDNIFIECICSWFVFRVCVYPMHLLRVCSWVYVRVCIRVCSNAFVQGFV
jgi:hypothetical protein